MAEGSSSRASSSAGDGKKAVGKVARLARSRAALVPSAGVYKSLFLTYFLIPSAARHVTKSSSEQCFRLCGDKRTQRCLATRANRARDGTDGAKGPQSAHVIDASCMSSLWRFNAERFNLRSTRSHRWGIECIFPSSAGKAASATTLSSAGSASKANANASKGKGKAVDRDSDSPAPALPPLPTAADSDLRDE